MSDLAFQKPKTRPARRQATPIVLPRLTADAAEAANASSVLRGAIELPGAAGFVLTVRQAPDGLDAAGLAAVAVSLGDADIEILLPHALMHDLLRSLGGSIDVEELPGDLLSLLLEASVAGLIEATEGFFGQALTVHGLSQADGTAHDIALRLEGPDGSWPVLVRCGEPVRDVLLADWPSADHDLEWLPMPARVRAGTTALPIAVARSLRAGDVVILETRLPEASAAMVVVADTIVARATIAGGMAEIADLLPTYPTEWTMSDHAEYQGGEGVEVDELPVRLAFDLGEIEVPVGQLRQIGPGTVLSLNRDATEFVDISANGRRVGRGELVDVDGSLGVRVISIFAGPEG